MKPRLDTVLAYVNMGRKALGLRALRKMPKGKQENPEQCPLSKALGVKCYRASVEGPAKKRTALQVAWLGLPVNSGYWISSKEVALPDVLHEFVNHFDDGEYPALVQK